MALSQAQASAVKVGDRIGFKCDVEQSSEVYGVRTNEWSGKLELLVEVTQGDYRHGRKWVDAERCFDHRPK